MPDDGARAAADDATGADAAEGTEDGPVADTGEGDAEEYAAPAEDWEGDETPLSQLWMYYDNDGVEQVGGG